MTRIFTIANIIESNVVRFQILFVFNKKDVHSLSISRFQIFLC